MSNFEIIIGNKIYDFDDSEELSTVFCIRVGNEYFPNQKWWDFPYSVLGTWIYNLLNNKEVFNTNFTLYFMDGPYDLKVYKDREMELTIQCINTRYKPKVEYSFKCNYYEFIQAIYDALKALNYLIYSNNLDESKFLGIYKEGIQYMKDIKSVIRKKV